MDAAAQRDQRFATAGITAINTNRRYDGDARSVAPDLRSRLLAGLDEGSLDADALLAGHCALLRERHCTIEEVARRTNLDRRTVKRYLAMEKRTESRQQP